MTDVFQERIESSIEDAREMLGKQGEKIAKEFLNRQSSSMAKDPIMQLKDLLDIVLEANKEMQVSGKSKEPEIKNVLFPQPTKSFWMNDVNDIYSNFTPGAKAGMVNALRRMKQASGNNNLDIMDAITNYEIQEDYTELTYLLMLLSQLQAPNTTINHARITKTERDISLLLRKIKNSSSSSVLSKILDPPIRYAQQMPPTQYFSSLHFNVNKNLY